MLGDYLRQARIEAGLSQEKLAFAAGVTRNYVSLLELNRKSPTLDVLIRLCRALRLKPSTLLHRMEQDPRWPRLEAEYKLSRPKPPTSPRSSSR